MKAYTAKQGKNDRFLINLYAFLVALAILPVCLFSQSDLNSDAQNTAEISANKEEIALKKNLEEAKKTEVEEISNQFESDEPVYSAPVAQIASNTTTSNTTTQAQPSYIYPNQIAIGGNIIPIFYSSNTAIDAGGQVGLWGSHFMYGHNYSNIFGILAYLPDGTRFTVTLNGETKNYQIVGRAILDYTDPSRPDYAQKHMYSLAVLGAYQGISYDYIMMTCAGQSLGGGNATHRLIVFANEV